MMVAFLGRWRATAVLLVALAAGELLVNGAGW